MMDVRCGGRAQTGSVLDSRGEGKGERGTHDEPPRVDDALEQDERLVHAVLSILLEQDLVVLGQGDAEDDGRDGLEAVDPAGRSE